MEKSSIIKVSVIIPVYNAEKYLGCLIDSLLAQTLKEMEFIFINDGSTDNSLNILKEYAKKDERIVIIDKENAGVSAARNDGLKIAKGVFVGFADADDFMAEDMYETLYQNAIKDGADIVCCGHKKFYSIEKTVPMFNEHEMILGSEEAIKNLLDRRVLSMSVWNKIYKKEILSDVVFCQKYKINEDRLFSFMALRKAKRIAIIKDTLYFYRMNSESASHSGFNKSTMDALYVSQDMHKIIQQEYPQMIDISNSDIAMSAYFVLVAMYRDNVYNDFFNEHKLLVREIKNLNLKKIKCLFTKSIYIQLLGVKYCEPILRCVKRVLIKKNLFN